MLENHIVKQFYIRTWQWKSMHSIQRFNSCTLFEFLEILQRFIYQYIRHFHVYLWPFYNIYTPMSIACDKTYILPWKTLVTWLKYWHWFFFSILGFICHFTINMRIEGHYFCLHWEMLRASQDLHVTSGLPFPNGKKTCRNVLQSLNTVWLFNKYSIIYSLLCPFFCLVLTIHLPSTHHSEKVQLSNNFWSYFGSDTLSLLAALTVTVTSCGYHNNVIIGKTDK